MFSKNIWAADQEELKWVSQRKCIALAKRHDLINRQRETQ